MLLLVVVALLALVSVPLVHEAGHAVAALLVGGRGVRFVRRGALSFATSAELPEGTLRRRAFYAGGPLANAVATTALIVACRALSLEPPLLVALGGAAFVHLAFALVNLLPFQGYDGRALLLATGGSKDGRGPASGFALSSRVPARGRGSLRRLSGRRRASSAPRGDR